MDDFYTDLMRVLSEDAVHGHITENIDAGYTKAGELAHEVLDQIGIDLSDAWQHSALTYPDGLVIGRPTEGAPPEFDDEQQAAVGRGCYIYMCIPWFGCGWYRVC